MEKSHSQGTRRRPIWDCDSSLYDSFELRSFKQQLDSAITARTYSMPHLPTPAAPPAPAPAPAPVRSTKRPSTSRISRSIHRLLRSVFRVKPAPRDTGGGRYGALATIPEACEKEVGSPELCSAPGKSVSERFGATAVRITCR